MALVAVTAALAVAGLVVSVNTLSSPTADVSHEPGPPNVGEAQRFAAGQLIATSFGSLIVYPIERLPGLTSEQLGGVTHGVQNLVGADSAQIEVAIALTNNTGTAVSYAPRQFLLRTGAGGPGVPPTTSSIRVGQLQSGASVTANLSFVVPQDGSRYWIEFTEPGRAQAIVVDLGNTEPAPPGSRDQPHH
jgi:hypothetical protein